MAVSKEELLSSKGLGTRPVDVPGVGEVIVRGLSRDEVVRAQETGNNGGFEAVALAAGLVNPELTLEEAKAWRASASAAAVGVVSDAILALSGLGTENQTEAEARFRSGDG